MRKQTRQLELFQNRAGQLERLPNHEREMVVTLLADLIVVVWDSTTVELEPASAQEVSGE